jgi:hypothetical protein
LADGTQALLWSNAFHVEDILLEIINNIKYENKAYFCILGQSKHVKCSLLIVTLVY